MRYCSSLRDLCGAFWEVWEVWMEATIDGVRIFYLPVGSERGYPLVVLHGGPGLDHTESSTQ